MDIGLIEFDFTLRDVGEPNVERLHKVLALFPESGLGIVATVPAGGGVDIVGAAKKRGLHEMEGFVLAKNQPMLKLAARLGFSIKPDLDDASVRICRLRLADTWRCNGMELAC